MIKDKKFEEALPWLKKGAHISRPCWDGAFLFLLPAGTVPISAIHDPKLRQVVEDRCHGAENFQAKAAIRRWNEDNTVSTGWTPTADDVLSEDWIIDKIEQQQNE